MRLARVIKRNLIDLGVCPYCFVRIRLTEQEVKERESLIREMIKPLACDKPIYKTRRIVPLPPYPCGHQLLWEQRCYRVGNKYIYSDIPPTKKDILAALNGGEKGGKQ